MFPVIYTIGHSTHPIDEFVSLLEEHDIRVLADVRSYPMSRRNPQFNGDSLKASLSERGIAYRWLKALGGRRRSKRCGSRHSAWQVEAFRAYADYADSIEFVAGLTELKTIASAASTAYMCSEGLWWQCHRRIISDYLTVAGWTISHILPNGKLARHILPDFARVIDGNIIYDGTDHL